MNSAPVIETGVDRQEMVDPVWEIRLRTWARKNYVESFARDLEWHPIVLDEMARIDAGH